MTLQEYIKAYYNNEPYWFRFEVLRQIHQERINNILDIKEYLSGKHKILLRIDEKYNGKNFKTRKIILQLAKTLLNFETSFLLKNPVTLTSDDDLTLQAFKEVYSDGRYNSVDFKILDRVVKYGECYEYLYINDKGDIVSRIIPVEDCYPIFDEYANMIGFIEFFIMDGVTHLTVYEEDIVRKYTNIGSGMPLLNRYQINFQNDQYRNLSSGTTLKLIGEYPNLSGLPVQYKTINELDLTQGWSSLNDYLSILDNMEEIISKYSDAFFKFLNPIPVLKGQKLTVGKNGEGQIDPNVVGNMLQLEGDSTFDFAINKMDNQSLKESWEILMSSLLNVSMTPAIALNAQNVSNLAETSIKMMYQLAGVKGRLNADAMKDGFIKRWDKMKKLLSLKGSNVDGEVDCVFTYDIPQSANDIVDNLVSLKGASLISTETALSQSPYTFDVQSELSRLKNEINKEVENDDNVSSGLTVDNAVNEDSHNVNDNQYQNANQRLMDIPIGGI